MSQNASRLETDARAAALHTRPFRIVTTAPRVEALHGIGGIYLLILGLSFLILPEGPRGFWVGPGWLGGGSAMIGGLALLWISGTALPARVVAVISLAVALPQALFAFEYARIGAITPAALLGLLALGYLLAPLAPASSAKDGWRPDGLGLVLGAAYAVQGLDVLFGPVGAIIIPRDPGILRVFVGVWFLISGIALVVVQFTPGLASWLRLLIHIGCGGSVLALWAAQSIFFDPIYWVVGAGAGVRGAAIILLPWWSKHVVQFDRHALRPRLALALITASLIPLTVVIPVVINAVEGSPIGPVAVSQRQLAFSVAILISFAAGVGGWWLAGQLAAPISKLTHSVSLVAQGQRDMPLSMHGPTEITQLCSAVASMADALDARALEREQLIAQLQQQNEELRTLEIEREDYIRAISHDLRNPLAAVSGRGQLLLRQLSQLGLEKEARSARTVVDLTARLSSMTQDLADSFRITAGNIPLGLTDLYLPVFMPEVRERIGEPEQIERIDIDMPDDLPVVAADPYQLERIVINLLSNALKYSPPDTRVVVMGERMADAVVVSVKDQGPGLSAEEQGHLFTRYYRSESTRSEQSGLGLGLYVTRALVEAHGGRIWVESMPGQGATFRFTLPRTITDELCAR